MRAGVSCVAAVFLAAAPAVAGAQVVDWLSTSTYAGVNFGKASSSASAQGVASDLNNLRSDANAFTINSVSVRESGLAWRLYFGKSLTDRFALEVGFVDLGNVDTVVDATVVDPAAYLLALAQVTPVSPGGVTLDLVGRGPLGSSDFHVFVRGGLFAWRSDVSYSTGTQTYRFRDDGIDLHGGVGLGWDYNARIGARLEFEHYGATTSMTQWSLGVLYRF